MRVNSLYLNQKQVNQLIFLQKLSLPADDPVTPSEEPEGEWFLMYENKILIAFGLITPSRQWLDTAYLSRCCVHPDNRGLGIQKSLIRRRERFSRKKGYTWIITDTSTDNPASSNSLIRCKYKIIYPSSPWGNENSIYWAKRL